LRGRKIADAPLQHRAALMAIDVCPPLDRVTNGPEVERPFKVREAQ
jgi:hypothetical protein